MSDMLQPDDTPAPPTSGIPELEVPASRWPTVIGVVCIILASIGLMCSCVGYFNVPLQRMGVEWAAKSGQADAVAEAQLRAAERFNIFFIAVLTVGVGLTIWLLVAAIALLRRRRSSRVQLIAYAMTSLFMLSLDIALQILTFQAAAAELNQLDQGQRVGEIWVSHVVQGFFIVLFGVAFQVFLLVWFSRARIKDEVATWRA